MKPSSLDQTAGLILRCVCVLALATASCCLVPAPRSKLDAGTLVGVGSAPPRGLDEIDTGCWDAASGALVEARGARAHDNVAALWDSLTRLSASPRPQHQELFTRLAQVFWERYVDCVLSRAHGLGRRHAGDQHHTL
ncbi:hypothetical protein C0J45_3539 [Silurus meridionalis]|nr:hypothetical protein C0J45_3539 [Silurus meridionalis]